MNDAHSPYWTVAETAAYLRCSERTVYEMVRRGQLDYVRTGRTRGTRILGASVERLLRTQPAAG
jgi:excisionase family DNA binding protein